MKHTVKLTLLLIHLAVFIVCTEKENLKAPVYETSFIRKASSVIKIN